MTAWRLWTPHERFFELAQTWLCYTTTTYILVVSTCSFPSSRSRSSRGRGRRNRSRSKAQLEKHNCVQGLPCTQLSCRNTRGKIVALRMSSCWETVDKAVLCLLVPKLASVPRNACGFKSNNRSKDIGKFNEYTYRAHCTEPETSSYMSGLIELSNTLAAVVVLEVLKPIFGSCGTCTADGFHLEVMVALVYVCGDARSLPHFLDC